MESRNTYLQKNIDALQKPEANNEIPDIGKFNLELDFVEQYMDADDVRHIKTFFNHEDMEESDLWEVFYIKNGSNSLELLLQNNI